MVAVRSMVSSSAVTAGAATKTLRFPGLDVLEPVGHPTADLQKAGSLPVQRQRSSVRGLSRQRRANSCWLR